MRGSFRSLLPIAEQLAADAVVGKALMYAVEVGRPHSATNRMNSCSLSLIEPQYALYGGFGFIVCCNFLMFMYFIDKNFFSMFVTRYDRPQAVQLPRFQR